MDYFFEEELLMLIPGLLSGVPTGLFGIAMYILSALSIYTISCRRGLKNPWLAWIPLVNVWLLGSLSDQYQYVVKGANKSRRKWLLLMNVLKSVLVLVLVVLGAVAVGVMVVGRPSRLMGPAMAALGLLLPLAGVSIAFCVIRFMALYDVYRSLDPDNSVLYLVLSILFSPTESFFLFFNRDKDKGMPPRRQQTVEAEVYEEIL